MPLAETDCAISSVLLNVYSMLRCNNGSVDISYLENAATIQRQ
jgi:hypothetical protein